MTLYSELCNYRAHWYVRKRNTDAWKRAISKTVSFDTESAAFSCTSTIHIVMQRHCNDNKFTNARGKTQISKITEMPCEFTRPTTLRTTTERQTRFYRFVHARTIARNNFFRFCVGLSFSLHQFHATSSKILFQINHVPIYMNHHQI